MSEGATPQDLPALLALLRSCDLLEQGVTECLPGFVVARAGEALLGCAAIERHEHYGLLRSVAVAPAARRQGIGRALVTEQLQRARHADLSGLYLLTTTAARFFERFGFKVTPRSAVPDPIATSWEFRAGCPATATVMRWRY